VLEAKVVVKYLEPLRFLGEYCVAGGGVSGKRVDVSDWFGVVE